MGERPRVTVAGVQVSVDHYVGGRRVSSATTFEDRSPLDWSPLLAEVSAGDADVAGEAVTAAAVGALASESRPTNALGTQNGYYPQVEYALDLPAGGQTALLHFAVHAETAVVESELHRVAGHANEEIGHCGGPDSPELRLCRDEAACPEVLGWCNDDPTTEVRCQEDVDCPND